MHTSISILTAAALLSAAPLLTPAASAETLRFAWPDGASAEVRAHSEGRRTGRGPKDITWDMTADFTTRVRHAGERVRIERAGFSGWKGTYPPSFGGGAERFTDMIPTFIVTKDGEFVGIEGQEEARARMNRSVEQSGGLDAASRNMFETMMSDAALRAMASDFWSALVVLWEDVELDPEQTYELRNATTVPQLGGGQVEILGEVRFVKEAPCAAGQSARCLHFHSETAANREQVMKLVESALKQATGAGPAITGWDQRFEVNIVVDAATTLPQQLTLTRLHAIEVTVQGHAERGSEEITKTYDFQWTVPEQKK